MALRLHEIHPSLVHYPLALFPAAVVADLLGRLTGSRTLMSVGKGLMPIAAGSAALAGAAGLVAQEAVKANGVAQDVLATHRNMNLGLIAASMAMSAMRARRQKPSAAYLLAGLAGMAAMSFTAYLGGKMVYQHGVGVEAAHGVDHARSPELRRGTIRETARQSRELALHGARNAAQNLRQGRIAPSLRRPAQV